MSPCSTAAANSRRRLATRPVPLKDMKDAYEEVVYRTTITAIMVV
jgi:hypothetical protein